MAEFDYQSTQYEKENEPFTRMREAYQEFLLWEKVWQRDQVREHGNFDSSLKTRAMHLSGVIAENYYDLAESELGSESFCRFYLKELKKINKPLEEKETVADRGLKILAQYIYREFSSQDSGKGTITEQNERFRDFAMERFPALMERYLDEEKMQKARYDVALQDVRRNNHKVYAIGGSVLAVALAAACLNAYFSHKEEDKPHRVPESPPRVRQPERKALEPPKPVNHAERVKPTDQDVSDHFGVKKHDPIYPLGGVGR